MSALVLTPAERRQIREQRIETSRLDRQRQSCNGWNFHVYSFACDRCTMCGQVKP